MLDNLLNDEFLLTLGITFKLALITTAILSVLGIMLSYLFVFMKPPLKSFFQAIVSMPLVLPPSVLGFYLLVTFSPTSPLGDFLRTYFGITLVFTFQGLVLASVIFSLPFMVNPIQAAFEAIPKNLIEVSYTLGKSKLSTLCQVIIPNAKAGILTGCIISFAHTVGEFGVVMMIGGHKKGETLVASIAIYDELEALNYALAHQYAFVLFVLSFVILLSVYFINKRFSY